MCSRRDRLFRLVTLSLAVLSCDGVSEVSAARSPWYHRQAHRVRQASPTSSDASSPQQSSAASTDASATSPKVGTVEIPSTLWGNCRQPIPCTVNPAIKKAFTADACSLVAAEYGDNSQEDLGAYIAIGPYKASDQAQCQVVVSNLGNDPITFARPDLMKAVKDLSSSCLAKDPAYNAVICDLNYGSKGGSIHISITAVGEKDYEPIVSGSSDARGGKTSAAGATAGNRPDPVQGPSSAAHRVSSREGMTSATQPSSGGQSSIARSSSSEAGMTTMRF